MGTTIVQVRVPVTYRFHIHLRDPWKLEVADSKVTVLAPALSCSRFHQTRDHMKPTIEIIITPTGAITIDAVGFKGADCESATRYLEEALGATTERQRKPEYQQQRKSHRQQRIGS